MSIGIFGKPIQIQSFNELQVYVIELKVNTFSRTYTIHISFIEHCFDFENSRYLAS